MNEVEKLYEEYLGLGYNQNMAIAKMRFAGYDDDAVNGMMGMYSKKKSQDSGVSDSSSEAGSTESTSAGSVPQQPELGDSDTPVVDDRLQGLTGDFGALNYDIPSYSVSGSSSIDPSMMPMGKDSGIKLNAESFLNGGDPSFERLFHGLHSHSFQNWAYQNEYVDADFLKEHSEEFGYTPFAYTYGHVLDKIAMKQTLDEKTQENIKSGMSVEDALAQNDVLTEDLNMAWEEWRKGKNRKSGHPALRDRFVKTRLKQVEGRYEKKRDALDIEYQKYVSEKLVDSLTNQGMKERDGDGELTPGAKSKLALLETQLKRTMGTRLDLTGDGKVGHRPFFRARMIPGMGPNFRFEGDLVDSSEIAGLSVLNGAIWLGSKLFSSGSSMFNEDVYFDGVNQEFVNGKGSYEWNSEVAMKMNENQISEIRERMNVYQKGVLDSYANNDFANAIEQSFLMTAEGWPFLVPLLFSEALGPYGIAGVNSLMGVVTEASAIRNDYTFDNFIKDGKSYSYYEAADIAGDDDINEILKQFDQQEDNLGRAGYLTAVGAGDFAIGVTSFKAFRGAYVKAQAAEMKNFLTGYARGLGIALPENALADFSAVVLREATRDRVTDEPEPDVNDMLRNALDVAIARVPTTGLIYTGGRLTVTPASKARAKEVIPMNSEEIIRLSQEVRDQQLKTLTATNKTGAADAYAVLGRKMERLNKLYYTNELYMNYLRKNNFDAYENTMDTLISIDQLKAKYNLTNDAPLQMEIKLAVEGELQKLTKSYSDNSKAFEEAIGLRGQGMGVIEREMIRGQQGMSVKDAMRDAMTPLQSRPVPEQPVPVSPDSPEVRARVASEVEVRMADDWLPSNIEDMDATSMNKGKLEEVLRGDGFATLTAENPNNTVIGENENARLNTAAREWLKSKGLEFHEILGRYDGKGERSFLVEGMSKQQAMDFARDFNQHSVLTSEGLVKADGSLLPTKGDWSIDQSVVAGDNYTSATKLNDGSVIKFAKDLDDGKAVDAKGDKITDKEFWNGTESDVPVPEAPDPTPINPEYDTNRFKAFAHRARAQMSRWWNFGVKSHGGVTNKDVEEVYRSRERLTSRATDDSEYDVLTVKGFLKGYDKVQGTSYDAFNKFLRGEIGIDSPSFKNLSKDQIGALKGLSENRDALSEVVIETLEALPISNPAEAAARQELIQTIRSQKGKYLHQQYEIFTDGGERLDLLLRPRKQMPPKLRKVFDEAVRETASRIENPDMAEQMTRQYLMNLRGEGGNYGALGAMNSPFLKSKNNQIPEAYKNLLGVIDDPVHAYLSTVSKLREYAAMSRWQTELAIVLQESGLGRIGSNFEGTEGAMGLYEKMAPNSAEWEPLHHMYIPKELKQGFQNLDPLGSWRSIMGDSPAGSLASTMASGWTRAAGFSKVGKTVMSPTSTNRNMVSGVFLQMANGHFFLTNPTKMWDAASLAWGNQNQKPGSSWRQERAKLIEGGVLNDGANSMELMKSIGEALNKRGNRLTRENQIWEFARKYYSFGDDFYKVSGYYIEKQRFIEAGMDPVQAEALAMRRVRDGYPTYSKISKGAKALRRLPTNGSFVSFPYEMIRTTKNQFNFIAEDLKAGRTDMALMRALGLATSLTMSDGLSEYSKDLHGLDDQDDAAVRWFGPEWQKLSKLLYLGKENETPYFMDLSYTYPHETITKPLRALFGYDPEAEDYMDNVNKAVEEAFSPYADTDLFTGSMKQIVENKDENGRPIILVEPGSNWVQEIATDSEKAFLMFNHLQKKLAPGFVGNALEFLRSSEPVEEDHPMYDMQRQFNKYYPKETRYRVYTHGDALLGMLGFRMTYLPLDYASENKIREQISFTSDTENYFENQINKGVPISVEEAQEACESFIRHFERSESLIKQSITAMKKLNMSEEKIIEILLYAGVPKKQAGQYLEGDPVPVLGVTTQSIINDANQAIRSSRLTDEEKEERIENIANAISVWNETIGNYNDKRDKEAQED